jgi:hypothetical protein
MRYLLPGFNCKHCSGQMPQGRVFCPFCGRDRFVGVKQWEYILGGFSILCLFVLIHTGSTWIDHALRPLFVAHDPLFIQTTSPTLALSGSILTIEPSTSTIPTPSRAILSTVDRCAGTLPPRLIKGNYAYVSQDPPLDNRVRSGAALSYPIVGYITTGHTVQVLDGPQCADGYFWWKVQSTRNSSVMGWSAEGDSLTYWLIPCASKAACP